MSRRLKSRRAYRRVRVRPMYTAVTACRAAAEGGSPLAGHVYDISEGGVRIELDEPLEPGESVELRLDLPGTHAAVAASASVVWVHDASDDPGPRRMALRFTGFAQASDRDRLAGYLRRESALAA